MIYIFVEDKTPINLRIAPDNNKHTNGALGIKKIILSSKNTEKIAWPKRSIK